MNFMKVMMVIYAVSLMITMHASNTPVQKIGLNFTATKVSDQIKGIPDLPNDTGAVGTQQYVCATYGKIISFNKFTGISDGALNIDAGSFFNLSAEDPVIMYNLFAHRWVVSCEDIAPYGGIFPYNIHLAVSSGDPLTVSTSWQMTEIPSAIVNPLGGPNGSVDNQRPAFDENNTYLGIACYNQNEVYVGGSAVVINTASLLAGSPIITVFPGLSPNGNVFELSTLTVATNFDANPEFGYFLSSNYLAPDYLTGTTLNLWRIVNARTTSPSIFPTTSQGIQLNVPPYAISLAGQGGAIPNKGQLFGSAGLLQVDYEGSPWQALVRNKQLFTSHSVLVDKNGFSSPTGDRYATRIYQFDLTGDPSGNGGLTETESTVPFLIQTITLYDQDPTTTAPKNFWNGSIMTNIDGELVVGVTVAGADDYPNVAYAGRLKNDPLGSLRLPVLATHSSFALNLSPFELFPFGQRWGDGSSMAIDPSNGRDFWSTNMFTAEEDCWGVQATQLIPINEFKS